jgi:hypothetical protein
MPRRPSNPSTAGAVASAPAAADPGGGAAARNSQGDGAAGVSAPAAPETCAGLGVQVACPGCLDCCGVDGCPGCAAWVGNFAGLPPLLAASAFVSAHEVGIVLGLGLAVGLVVGWALGSRWAATGIVNDVLGPRRLADCVRREPKTSEVNIQATCSAFGRRTWQ